MSEQPNAPATPSRRYALVSPCRDEGQYVRRTLDSIVGQTVTPARWVIVDDGSTDDTPEILAEYAQRHDFIEIHRREDRGRRSVGPGVVDAFYAGYERLRPRDYDYVCKLDVDLEIPPGYFERMMQRMEAEPRVGTCSGKPYFPGPDGTLVSEAIGDEMSAGMIKFYRTKCFEEIGGFVREVMWDGIDCHRCRMLGWIAHSWDDPDVRFIHLRAMGSSHQDIWTGRVRWGFGQYFMGTGVPWIVASAAFRMTRPPVVTGGAAMLYGYFRSLLKREARYDDPQFRAFLRRYHREALRHGKAEATRRVDERQASVWRRTHP